MRIELTYPDKRWVSEETIVGWYKDLVTDGKIPEADHEVDIWEAVIALEDAGVITSTGRSRE